MISCENHVTSHFFVALMPLHSPSSRASPIIFPTTWFVISIMPIWATATSRQEWEMRRRTNTKWLQNPSSFRVWKWRFHASTRRVTVILCAWWFQAFCSINLCRHDFKKTHSHGTFFKDKDVCHDMPWCVCFWIESISLGFLALSDSSCTRVQMWTSEKCQENSGIQLSIRYASLDVFGSANALSFYPLHTKNTKSGAVPTRRLASWTNWRPSWITSTSCRSDAQNWPSSSWLTALSLHAKFKKNCFIGEELIDFWRDYFWDFIWVWINTY